VPSARPRLHRRGGTFPFPHHRAGALHRPHAALSRQGAAGRRARAHHAALLSQRADEPARRTLPQRACDAHGPRRRGSRRALRLRRGDSLTRAKSGRAAPDTVGPSQDFVTKRWQSVQISRWFFTERDRTITEYSRILGVAVARGIFFVESLQRR